MEQNSKRIRDIYNYYLIDEITMPKKYYDIGDKIEKMKKEIAEHLPEKYVEMLEEMCQAFFDMGIIDSEESFVAGYSVATQITAEAFTTRYNKIKIKE